ncbi:MAG: NrfD/PsrC family molybdoenzyme membrane anchor subunit [Aquificaceae bacterium]|nr:NrfD/PsrC family molybdoenzyme membrane anchor subunit [Aquificaceae bacterium]
MIESLGVALPNHKVEWTVLIVTYPFFSGIVAGSTVISLLVYLLGYKNLAHLERVGHFVALSCLLVAPLAPLFDLTMPARGFLVPFYPNLSSPIFLFFVFWTLLFIVMLLKSYFLLRRDFIGRAKEGGFFGSLAGFLTFGARDVNPEEDDKKVRFWALISFPLAFAFTGYVGFLLSAMQAVPMWGSHILIPVFLVSAVVSGIGASLFFYLVGNSFQEISVRAEDLRLPVVIMAVFAGLDLLLLFLEIILEWYWNTAHWPLLASAMGANLLSYLIAILALLFVFLGGFTGLGRSTGGITLLSIASLLGIYAMRWITVIPPQMVDKGGRAVVSPHIKLIGREGFSEVIALFLLGLFFILLFASVAGWRSTHHKEVT